MTQGIFKFCISCFVLIAFEMKEASIEGPIFRDQSDQFEKSKYTSELIKIILREADKRVRKYYEAGDFEAYYAFLTMALTVPLHEGVYVHFRGVEGDVCKSEASSGELVRNSNVGVWV